MRASIVLIGLALALSGCGRKDSNGNAAAGDKGLTAESIVANDVTAIDAVTADAANMAADVQINFTNEVSGNETGSSRSAKPVREPGPKAPATQPAEPASPAAETPAANSTANATE